MNANARYLEIKAANPTMDEIAICKTIMKEGFTMQQAADACWAASNQRRPHPDDYRAVGAYNRRAEKSYRNY